MRALNISAKKLSLAYDVKNKYLGWGSEERPMEAKESNAPWVKGLNKHKLMFPRCSLHFPDEITSYLVLTPEIITKLPYFHI